MNGPDSRPDNRSPAWRAAECAARESYGKLLALLAVRSHDVAAAEDALADAFATVEDDHGHCGRDSLHPLGLPRHPVSVSCMRLSKINGKNRLTPIPGIQLGQLQAQGIRRAVLGTGYSRVLWKSRR